MSLKMSILVGPSPGQFLVCPVHITNQDHEHNGMEKMRKSGHGVGYRIMLFHELKPMPLGVMGFVCTEPEVARGYDSGDVGGRRPIPSITQPNA